MKVLLCPSPEREPNSFVYALSANPPNASYAASYGDAIPLFLLCRINVKRHALCMDGGMYGCPANAQLCVAYPSASGATQPPTRTARMHACGACVVRALRHVFVSRLKLKPQAGLRGHPKPNLPLPFSSLLAFLSPWQARRKQSTS